MSLYHLLLTSVLVFFLLFGVFWICFARISMTYIEREMKKEGKEAPTWDGMGARAFSYALVILLPTGILKNYVVVDVEAAKRLSRPRDRKLAAWYVSVGFMLMAAVLITYFCYPDMP